jgi:outer membrane protein
MVSRHALVFGIGVTLAGSVAALAQPPSNGTMPPPPPGMPPSAQPGTPQSGAPGSHVPRTLAEALAATYSNQPALQAERAKLRATDENVPTALAGWRPTVVLAGTAGYGDGVSRSFSGLDALVGLDPRSKVQTDRDIASAQATVTQPIYSGGKTQATVNHAKDAVMAERANLISQEQTSFTNTVNAYVGVIMDQDLLALNINNEQVLAKQLQATNDRFRVGEITRTDVAQAEAALAGATASRQTAEGTLATARATFVQIVGFDPPPNLVEPQPLVLPVHNDHEAAVLAAANNPNVVSAQFNDSAAKDQVDIAFSQLLPQVSLQGQTFDQENPGIRTSETTGYQVIAQVSVPLYQGGAEYSAVRQAKQSEQQTARLVGDAQRTAVQAAVNAWETLVAATAAADSTRSQIRANAVALEGVEREAIVGSRTTLDVLNAEQLLLNSRVTLVQNLAQLVTASYGVAAAIGRLTARDLHLPVPLYDETAYYNAVKDKWFGLGDYATNQPGR